MKLAQLAQLNCCFRSIHLLAGDLSPASAFRHFTLLHRAAPDYSPGDLLVAPDVFLPHDEDALSELLSRISANTCAGLIVSAADDYDPAPLRQKQQGRSLPILALPPYTDTNEVFRLLEAALLGEGCYTSFICRLFQKRVKDLSHTNPHATEAAAVLCDFLKRPVLLFSSHYSLPHASLEAECAQTAKLLWRQCRDQHGPSSAQSGSECYHFFPISNSQETVAHLCVVCPAGAPPSSVDRALIETALPQIALLLMQNLLQVPLFYKKPSAFLEAILSGVFSDAPEQLIQNARFLTIEYACERFLCIVEAAPMGAFAGGAFVGHINEYFTSMRRRFLLLQQGGSRLIYVVESDVSRRALEELEQLVLPQLECLASNSAGLQLRVGVSSHFPSLSELQQAFSEADFSLQLGGKMDPGKTLYFYSDYLLYHLLDSIKQTSAISLIYSEVITVLSDYDRQNNTELLDTLLSLCQNNFNAIQAADKMYLHRNSLYKRIERITSILDMDLDLPDNIIVLHLAAKLHELLN